MNDSSADLMRLCQRGVDALLDIKATLRQVDILAESTKGAAMEALEGRVEDLEDIAEIIRGGVMEKHPHYDEDDDGQDDGPTPDPLRDIFGVSDAKGFGRPGRR
jgi:hypothetical protein